MAHSPEASTYRDSIDSEASGPVVVAKEELGINAAINGGVDSVSVISATCKNGPDVEQSDACGEAQEVVLTTPATNNNQLRVHRPKDDVEDDEVEVEAEGEEEEELINELPPDELCIIDTSSVLELPLDEIPEPIKVLDDIISEFEDASKPLLLHAANGENQSEDDGYMSLSRKNLPKKDSEELSQNSLDSATTPTSANSANIGGSTTAIEALGHRSIDELHHQLPPPGLIVTETIQGDAVDAATNERLPLKKRKERVSGCGAGTEIPIPAIDVETSETLKGSKLPAAVPEAGELAQTTLPKMRSFTNSSALGGAGGASIITTVSSGTATNKNYSSLPCCGAGRSTAANATAEGGGGLLAGSVGHALGGLQGAGGAGLRSAGSYNGERLQLGIDISAVHNAVLRGGLAKLPEPILNEHPVTIYPGPPSSAHGSKQANARNQHHHHHHHHHNNNKLSVEKHKDMCHMINSMPVMSSSNSSSNSSSSSSSSASSSSASHSSSSATSPAVAATASSIRHSTGSGQRMRGNSTDFQQIKPHGVAWEIHFDVDELTQKMSSGKDRTPVKTPKRFAAAAAAKKIAPPLLFNDYIRKDNLPPPPPQAILNNRTYQDTDMLGKGTFIIRRNGAGVKKTMPPRAADIFQAMPMPVSTSSSAISASEDDDVGDEEDADEDEDEDDSLPPPPPPLEASHNNTNPNSNKRGRQSDREKLTLNFEVAAIAKSLSPLSSLSGPPSGCVAPLSLELQSTDESLNEKSSSLEEEEYEDDATLGQAYDVYDFTAVPPPPPPPLCTTSGNMVVVSPTGLTNGCPLMGGGPSPTGTTSVTTSGTPRTDLAPTLEEEDEEQYSDFSYGGGVKAAVGDSAPLKQIESNISALLRGDIAVARVCVTGTGETSPLGSTAPLITPGGGSGLPPLPGPSTTTTATAIQATCGATSAAKRALEFRPGVHKSESGKEMLLSQTVLGPLPPSPPSSSSDFFDYDDRLPPLPPLPPASPAGALIGLGVVATPPGAQQPPGLKGHHGVGVHGPHPQPPLPAPPVPASASTVAVASSFRRTASVEIHAPYTPRPEEKRQRGTGGRHFTDELPLPLPPTFEMPPAVPPHRSGGERGVGGHSMNTIKSWSIDSNYKRRKSPRMGGGGGYIIGGGMGALTGGSGGGGGSGMTTPTGPPPPVPMYDGAYSTRRYVSYGGGMGVGHMGTGTKQRSLRQSPREEHRLQTSCSLPETPIFARGCDIPRTPFRRQTESNTVGGLPGAPSMVGGGGSRTAPRSSTAHNINMGNSIVGIAGGSAFGTSVCRQRSINHALASNEMLRLSGAPGRGWYPKQRSMRPASTENIDRLASVGGACSGGGGSGVGVSSSASSGRVWDSAAGMSGTGGHSRKPLTLPPNLTPSFLNKSPREALRRVTSLLITKKKGTKDRRSKPYADPGGQCFGYDMDAELCGKDNGGHSSAPRSSHKNQHSTSSSGGSTTTKTKEKKKGLFKSLWKRSKQSVSMEQ